jgi:hypothetical protein
MWYFDSTAMTFDNPAYKFDGSSPSAPPAIPAGGAFGTNLWSADGNYNWTADGYTGWSADGYEPTNLEVATADLASFGVNVGPLTYQYDPLVPLGYVITGYVPFLNVNYAGQYIPLVISNGPAPGSTILTVPNLVGLFYYDAQLAINDAGLLIAPPIWVLTSPPAPPRSDFAFGISGFGVGSFGVTPLPPPGVLPQYVVSQSIPAFTQLTQATQVTITVSGFTAINQPNIPTAVP